MSNQDFFDYCQEEYEKTKNPLCVWYAILLSDGDLPAWVLSYLQDAAKGIVSARFQDFGQKNKDAESARYFKNCLQINNSHINKIENKNRDRKIFFDIIDIAVENDCSNSEAMDLYSQQGDACHLTREYIERIFFREQKKAGGRDIADRLKSLNQNEPRD